jgi:predicted NBD/HSP70 family sugar kinase
MRRGANPAGALRSLRERNRVAVVDVLRRQGTASRAEIARQTGLSRSTVSSLVTELQGAGLVVERGGDVTTSGAQGGRPGVLLALEPRAGCAVGVDFGHTHIRVAVADLSSRVLAEHHRELDVDRSAHEALDAAAALVGELLAEAGVKRDGVVAVGMGLPGPLDRATGTIGSSVILPSWAGLQPAVEFGRRLNLPIEVDNDANLGALAELTYGSLRGATDLIYVKVASGIGAGLILGGRLHRGAIGIAGELGHVIVDTDGHVCRCGNRGCLETVAAGPALLALLRPAYGDDFTTHDLLQRSAAGDVGCRRVLADAGRAIGRALADLINCVNPRFVVTGGELSAAGEPLLAGIRESIERFALPASAAAMTVTCSELGDRAELLGALALVIARANPASLAGAPSTP